MKLLFKMKNLSLSILEKTIRDYATTINAPSELIPSFGKSEDFAKPHIEIDNDGNFNYIIIERGEELERKVFSSTNELYFQVFKDITFSMASNYELKNRVDGQDFRILLFEKQEEYLSLLDKEWALKEKQRHDNLLNKA